MSAIPLDPDRAGRLLTPPAPLPLGPVRRPARRGTTDHAASPEPVRPDPERWFATFSLALVEVLTGSRQSQQLVRWLAPEIYSAISRRAGLHVRLYGRPARPLHGHVLSVRVNPSADDALELCSVVHDGIRVRAVAARLEVFRERWRVTELQIG